MERRNALGTMLILLLVSILTGAFNVPSAKAVGTIYIRPDGSINPPTAPIQNVGNVSYTLTADIYYYSIVIQRGNIVVDGASHTIYGTGDSASQYGIDIQAGADNVTLRNTKVRSWDHGITIRSSYNTILNNTASRCYFEGIWIRGSGWNILDSNNASDNALAIGAMGDGIWDLSYGNNVLIRNIALNNRDGIAIWSDENLIIHNTASNNHEYGFWLVASSNQLVGNVISNNAVAGIYAEWAGGNMLYHNNFINNPIQAFDDESGFDPNSWNYNYPLGGNYWSDYTGVDEKSGPNQDQPGSDGIGDTPYTVSGTRKDFYPLMQPYVPSIHDIGITSIEPSQTEVGSGGSVSIGVRVENHGDFIESFSVITYAGGTAVGTQTVTNLFPAASLLLTFSWNTTGLAFGNYLIFAIASPVLGEAYTADNALTDGSIKVRPVYHDVAVTNVKILFDFAYIGENVTVDVETWNAGDFQETFNLTLYADLDTTTIGDEVTAGNQTLTLPSKGSAAVTFNWNTTGAAPGNYTLSAKASSVPKEADTTNNLFVDGRVEVAAPNCMDIDVACPAIVQLNPSIFSFDPSIRALVASLGSMTVKSTGFEGNLRIVGAASDTVNLFIDQPGTNRQTYFLPLDGSIEVPLWLGFKPGTYTGSYELTLKVCGAYKSKITLNIVHIWVCGNGAYTVQGGTATFSWTLTGGSWAYLKAEPRLPEGWSFSVDPPLDTLFETPQLVSLNITAAPDAGEEEIGIVTLSAFKNSTNIMFWQFTYFATVGNQPPTIEEVKPPTHTFDGSLSFSTTVKDSGAGLESVQLNYQITGSDWTSVAMNWQEGDTFNSTLYTVELPQLPDGSYIYYWINATDWLGEQTYSDIYETAVNYDIIVESVARAKTVVGSGSSCSITATISNQGVFSEELVKVTYYANTTLIHTQTVASIANGASANVTFTWDTTDFPKGNYTITAFASPVAGEIDDTDNMYTNGNIMVTLAGDVNGDKKVDGKDITGMARWFGKLISQLGDVPNARNLDINDDNKIDGKDITAAAINFGKTWT